MKNGRTFSSTYYAGKYKEFIAATEKAIPRSEHTHRGDLAVTVRCFVTKPRTTKRSNPRGDVDNYVKGVLDAMTKKDYWEDDDQICLLVVEKRFADGRGVYPLPGIEVMINRYEHDMETNQIR